MLLPHPGHGGSNAEHVHVADAGSSAQPGATATAGQAEPNLVSPPAPSPASHHGVGDARSPWTWLAGAGLAAMMVLMLL